MKKLLFPILGLSLISSLAFADCEPAYVKYRNETALAPITAPIQALASSTVGSATLGAGVVGTLISSQTEISSAATLYALAFSYEGHFHLESAWWNLRYFQSRSQVLSLIRQAKRGNGPMLYEFQSELNQRTLTGDYFTMKRLIELILQANEDKVFCPEHKEVFTMRNVANTLLEFIGDDSIVIDNDDDSLSSDDDELDDYWDQFPGL